MRLLRNTVRNVDSVDGALYENNGDAVRICSDEDAEDASRVQTKARGSATAARRLLISNLVDGKDDDAPRSTEGTCRGGYLAVTRKPHHGEAELSIAMNKP